MSRHNNALLVFAAVLLIAAISATPALARRKPPKGPESFTFYMHNQVYNPAVNNSVFDSVYSAGPLNFSQPNPYSFGVRSTFEDIITAGPERNSTQIGVGQGMWILSSQKAYDLYHIFTATITSGKYTGTISIMGSLKESVPVRTLTVIGGTGDFLAARGVCYNKLVTIDHTPPAHWSLSFDLDLYY